MTGIPYFLAYDSDNKLVHRSTGVIKIEKVLASFDENNKLIQKTFSLQKDLTDCGVGCLQSLVRFYGGDISLEILREKSGTSKTGTTLLGLYQCAKEIGFDAEGCEADIDALIEHGEPVILHIIIDQKYEHYVICYSYDSLGNSTFCIGDPAKGIEFWTKEDWKKPGFPKPVLL